MERITLEFVLQVVVTVVIFAVAWAAFDYRAQIRDFIMSRRRSGALAPDRADKPVYIPVSANQYDAHTTASARSGMAPPDDRAAPDMDAANPGMDWQPRLARYPEEHELIVYLAVIKTKSGKYQKSANDIAKFIGGDRNTVLRIVREVREGPPAFPPISPEQAAARADLGLEA